MKTIIFIQYLLVIACSGNQTQQANNNVKNVQQVEHKLQNSQYGFFHTFYSKDGVLLGKAYVLFIKNSKEIFTSLVITNEINGNIDTLYTIESTKLISKKGIDTEVYKQGFFGYKVILMKNDYIVLVLVNDNGEGVSDNLTIEWNYEEKMFELLKTP
jgi:hypothetical protein